MRLTAKAKDYELLRALVVEHLPHGGARRRLESDLVVWRQVIERPVFIVARSESVTEWQVGLAYDTKEYAVNKHGARRGLNAIRAAIGAPGTEEAHVDRLAPDAKWKENTVRNNMSSTINWLRGLPWCTPLADALSVGMSVDAGFVLYREDRVPNPPEIITDLCADRVLSCGREQGALS